MFGELIAVWIYEAWRAIGSPCVSPGRDRTGARHLDEKDMLRTSEASHDPALPRVHRSRSNSTSQRLRKVRKDTLAEHGFENGWHGKFAHCRRTAADRRRQGCFGAVSIRQFIARTANGWRERMVGLDTNGRLALLCRSGLLDRAAAPGAAPLMAPSSGWPRRSALMRRVTPYRAAGGCRPFSTMAICGPVLATRCGRCAGHAYEVG